MGKKPEEAAQEVRSIRRRKRCAIQRCDGDRLRGCRLITKPRVHTSCTQELLVNVAPKKANWDLKRDIQPKLDKLERRTQRAIMEILMEQVREQWRTCLALGALAQTTGSHSV